MKKEFSIASTDGKNTIHGVMWEPETDVKAILQISHGMIEYIERYDEFANYLNGRKILVVGSDHLGHGHTAASDDDLGYFGAEKSKTVVDDLYEVTRFVKQQYEGIPYILFGHSMGSFMARRYLMTYGSSLDGAIICGTGYTPGIALGMGIFLTKIVQLFRGEKYRPSSLKNIAFGGYNRRIKNAKTENDWLSRNEENVKKYNADKYCTFPFTVNGYQTLFDVLKFIQKRRNYEKIPHDLPIFLIAGEEDPVGSYGKGVKKVYYDYQKIGIKDISIKLFPEDRHEILNEVDRVDVYNTVVDWIKGGRS